MLKKLFSHTAIYGLAPQITKIASFFSLPLITAELTDLDYGVAGVLTAYTASISVLAALGLRVVLVNAFFKSPGQYKWAWRQIYGFLSIWNIFYAIILSVLLYLVIPQEARENQWTILLLKVGPLIFFGQTSTICSTYYQLEQKPLQIAVRSTIFGFLSIGLNVLFIAYYKMGYMGWFWSTFIVGILTNLSYFYPLNYILNLKPIFNFKRRLIRNSLKVSLPMIPHYYSGYLLNTSDKMVMDLMQVGTGNIGKYNVSYTVGNVMNSVGTASGLAVGPLLNKYYKEGREEPAKNLIFILQVSFFLATFGLCLWMKELFAFLIRNKDLAQMYSLGIIIVMAYNYRPLYLGFSTKTMYNERTNIMWKVTLGAGLINVILNVSLIPFFGFKIAAVTTFFAYMVMGYAGYYLKVFKEINNSHYHPMLWMILTIILTLIVYYAVEFSLVVKIGISIIVSVIGLFYILKINKLVNEG